MKKIALVLIVVCGGALSAHALSTATITSTNFSLGYGYTGSQTFNTTETAGQNTPSTVGNFSFVPTPLASVNSGAGPTFPGRVLGNGTSSTSGWAVTFTNSLAGAWLGGVPAETLLNPEINPNLRIRINITQISIYAQLFNGSGSMGFREITSGHTNDSPLTTLGGSFAAGWNTAANYTQVVWDPTDYEVSGTNFTRTFVLIGSNAGVLDSAIDGFEILGNVQFLYDVPEASALSLFGLGVAAIWFRKLKCH